MISRELNLSTAYLYPAPHPVPEGNLVEWPNRLRLVIPFPALVRGVDATGTRFEINTVLDSFTSNSLYLRLAHAVAVGDRLFVLVRLSLDPVLEQPGTRIGLKGVVLRVDPQPDARYGIAVSFARHRFLYDNAD